MPDLTRSFEICHGETITGIVLSEYVLRRSKWLQPLSFTAQFAQSACSAITETSDVQNPLH